jgi:hypothetical protein
MSRFIVLPEVDMTTSVTSSSEVCFATAAELARRIRDREISSAEVTDAFLARIVAHNDKLNAIVQVFEADARSRAREADDALARGQSWGPLHGVPVTIKEMFLMANTPSTLNSRRMKDFVAPEDGVIVKRLKSGGTVILGKTNVPANLQGYQVQGDIYPEGKNPHRLECSPGGSTGGGAAAVAAGMTALELGADGGGSLRVPAHFCGVFCLKPYQAWVGRGHRAILWRPRRAARPRLVRSCIQTLQERQRARFRWGSASIQRLLLALCWTVQRERPSGTRHAARHVEGRTSHRCPTYWSVLVGT